MPPAKVRTVNHVRDRTIRGTTMTEAHDTYSRVVDRCHVAIPVRRNIRDARPTDTECDLSSIRRNVRHIPFGEDVVEREVLE